MGRVGGRARTHAPCVWNTVGVVCAVAEAAAKCAPAAAEGEACMRVHVFVAGGACAARTFARGEKPSEAKVSLRL